ncbi:unnamed protein product [Sphenostylis stenocarpa]|uniref:Uncharacterized protein n=1 Tax=Sphenostylis stenocarpa TaxID=92480 RepID=A0AA86VC76_9FABA|nr:unnamed protein product [Sphenostylis stenocarpa]
MAHDNFYSNCVYLVLQLRVHCAEVLGTPIVGDYKYGWQAHRKWGHFDLSRVEDSREEVLKGETLPFGHNLNKGSISENHPRLHLHCKQIVLPNISQALQNMQSSSNCDISLVEGLELVADLPPYMQRNRFRRGKFFRSGFLRIHRMLV